jgi:hypothetical protein
MQTSASQRINYPVICVFSPWSLCLSGEFFLIATGLELQAITTLT